MRLLKQRISKISLINSSKNILIEIETNTIENELLNVKNVIDNVSLFTLFS